MKNILAIFIILLCLSANAANRYWVGGGSSFTWAATGQTNWSASSGGARNASVPGASDTVYFDYGASPCAITTTVNCKGLYMSSGYTGTISNIGAKNIYGSISMPTGSKWTNTGQINLKGTSAGHVIAIAITLNANLVINTTSGTYTLSNNLVMSASRRLTLTDGEFYSDGKTMTMGSISVNNSNTLMFDCTNSTINLIDNLGSIAVFTTSHLPDDLIFTGSTININTAQPIDSWSIDFFTCVGCTFNNINYDCSNMEANYGISFLNNGRNMSIDSLIISAGSYLWMGDVDSLTVNYLYAVGTVDDSIYLSTMYPTTSTNGLIIATNGTMIIMDYIVNLGVLANPETYEDTNLGINITGGSTYYAGSHSTDAGENTGWIYDDLPSAIIKNIFMGINF